MSRLETLGKNTASNFVFFFVSKSLSLISYAVLIRFIGLKEYGIILLISTLLGRLNFLQGGLGTALEKYIPKYRVNAEFQSIRKIISTTITFFFFIGFMIGVGLFFFPEWDGAMEFFKINVSKEIKHIFHIAALFSPFAWISNSLLSAIKGYNYHHYTNIVENLSQIVGLLLMSILAMLEFSLVWIFIGMHLPIFISVFLFSQKLNKLLGSNIYIPLSISKFIITFKEIFSYSFWVFLMQFSSVVINQFDRILVSGYLGITMLPVYVGIVQLMKTLTQITSKLNSAVVPIASELSETKSMNAFNEIGFKGTKIINSVAAPITSFVIIFAEIILKLLGKEFLIEYVDVFQIGLITYMIVSSKSFFQQMFIGAGNIVKELSILAITTSLTYLVVLHLITKEMATDGAILSLPITHWITLPFWFLIAEKKGGVSLVKFSKAVIHAQWPAITLIMIHLSIYWTMDFIIKEYMVIYYSLMLTIGIPIMLFLTYHFSILDEIKKLLTSKVRQVKKPTIT